MAKVGKFCLAKRVKVEWLFQQAHSMTKSSFSQGGENASSILPAIRV